MKNTIIVTMSDSTMERIARLSIESTSGGFSNVFRKAIGLYEKVIEVRNEGKRVLVEDNGKYTELIIE